MKVRIERDELRAALARVKPAVFTRGNAALAGVLIEATAEGITATATNLDVRITTTIEGQVNEPGTVLLPHATFDPLVNRCQPGAVELSTTDDGLALKAGHVKASLHLLDAVSFPKAAPLVDAREVELEEDWRAIQRVMHARGTDPAAPGRTHVRIGGGWAIATDGYRLARHSVRLDADLLLPAGPILAAAKVTPKWPVILRWSGRRFEIEAEGTTWAATGLEVDEFPPLESIERFFSTAGRSVTVKVDREELAAALDVVRALGAESYKDSNGRSYSTIVAVLTIANDELLVTGQRTEAGAAEVSIDARSTGEARVAFRSEYLQPFLDAMENDNVELVGVDGLKPWVATDEGLEQLIMPTKAG